MYKLFIILIYCILTLQANAQKQNEISLLKSLKYEKVPLKRIDLMLELAYIYIDRDSVTFFNQMRSIETLSTSNNYLKGLAEYSYTLGDYYYKKSKFDVSNTHYQQAKILFEKIHAQKRVADAYTCIGVNYSELSMYDKAIEPYINSEKNLSGITRYYRINSK